MIDIHCHILPNIDDGAKDIEDALEMARIAQKEGIKKIVNTSHYHPTFDFIKGEALVEKVQNFNAILKENNIDIEVFLGNELYYSEDFLEIIDLKEFHTLNNSRYLLVEFPPLRFPKNLCDVIYEIKLRGYIPVLAHVERYREVQNDPNIIYNCIKDGAIIQLNASSIVGKNGDEAQKVSKILLDNNMVHVIGTDSHSSKKRRPIIKESYDFISQKYSSNKASELFLENPTKIINNEDINVNTYTKYEKPKGFFKKLFKR